MAPLTGFQDRKVSKESFPEAGSYGEMQEASAGFIWQDNRPPSLAPPDVRKRCVELSRQLRSVRRAKRAFAVLRKCADTYPEDPEVVISYALAVERSKLKSGQLELWTSISERFPDDIRPWRFRVRWLGRSGNIAEAMAIVSRRQFTRPAVLEEKIVNATLLAELPDPFYAISAFNGLLEDNPEDANLRLQFARRLRLWGLHLRALNVLQPVLDKPGTPAAANAMGKELKLAFAALYPDLPEIVDDQELTEVDALEYVLVKYKTRTVPPQLTNTIGNVALITGSLGPGGAERQLVRTAICLEEARRNGEVLGGKVVAGTIRVAVRNLLRNNDSDFFAGDLARNRIEVAQLDDIAPLKLTELSENDAQRAAVFSLLSSQVRYGLTRLSQYFRHHPTDIAYIWQDGAVLFSALAALHAGVPRIVLNMRGQPPNVRGHRFKAEYKVLYKILAEIPGVFFVANSRAGARAYAEWLEVSVERFAVIHNGIVSIDSDASDRERLRWQKFESRTPGASRTIGGLFRHNIDKRPLLWVDMAREYLERDPSARFVLVGNGPLTDEIRQRIDQYGLRGRILIAGRSHSIGFWLSKFSVLVSLSQFEGFPNALIEAQVCGVPVVATPAGGSAETFVEGETGCSTMDLDCSNLSGIVNIIQEVCKWKEKVQDLDEVIRKSVLERHSTRKMIAATAVALTQEMNSPLGA